MIRALVSLNESVAGALLFEDGETGEYHGRHNEQADTHSQISTAFLIPIIENFYFLSNTGEEKVYLR